MSSESENTSSQDKVVEGLSRYANISFGLILLGVGLILFGIAGLESYDKNMTGPPYFVSGIVVGCLELFSAILCARILQTSSEITHDEIHKGFLTSQINRQLKFSTFCVIISMLGILMALIGGYAKALAEDRSEGVNRFLASVIVIGCGLAFFIETYALYVANSYDRYFKLCKPPPELRYRPGNGYLKKNLNTYLSNTNGSVHQEFRYSVQQQLARQNQDGNIENNTQQEQQRQHDQSSPQEQKTVEFSGLENAFKANEEINETLLTERDERDP